MPRTSKLPCLGCGRPSIWTYCSVCNNKRDQARRLALKGHLKFALRIARRSKHFADDIDAEWLEALFHVQGGRCALSNIPMTFGPKSNTAISIDRIDSSLPYVRSNVQLVCRVINFMKHDLPQSTFIHLCSLISPMTHRPPEGGASIALAPHGSPPDCRSRP